MQSETVSSPKVTAPRETGESEANDKPSARTKNYMPLWKVVKWAAYRLPMVATVVVASIFLTKDGLSQSQSPAILLVVNAFTEHLALILVSLLMILILCVPLWVLADYYDRPYLWRARKQELSPCHAEEVSIQERIGA